MLFVFLISIGLVLADPSKTIVENAVGRSDLSTLVKVLTMDEYAPILQALSDESINVTLFAPNDAALNAAGLDLAKVEKITATLTYHVAAGGGFTAAELQGVQFLESLSTGTRYVNVGDGKGQNLFLEGGERVVIYFSNKRATVVDANIMCSNGVVHIIDEVIELPPIVSNAILYSGLNNLLQAVIRADLVDVVDTTAALTIFSPTDEAFRKAGIVIDDVPKETLVEILSYHVVPGVAFSTDLSDGDMLPTLLTGKSLGVTVERGVPRINGANIVNDNVLTRNGVTHFIDAVLIPENRLEQVTPRKQ